MAIFFQLDFPVYFVTRGSKLIIDLIFTFLCDFYKILNNVFDQYSLFREFTFLAIFFGSLLGRSDFKIFCKNAASAATFKFWGVTVLGHICFGRPLGGEFTVRKKFSKNVLESKLWYQMRENLAVIISLHYCSLNW